MKPETKILFDNSFGKHAMLGNDAYSYLNENFLEKTYSSREVIVEGGNVPKYFYLVISGLQMIYLISNQGEKVVLGFSYHGNISGVYDAFVTQAASTLFLEAITPTKMLAITRDKYLQLFDLFPELYKWRAHFNESILFGRLSRERELMTMSAKERYDAFIARCPQELFNTPQKYLASYLGMTPETFSRLRSLRN